MTSGSPESCAALITPADTPDTAISSRRGYCRVSTKDQNPRLQIEALIAAGIPEKDIYVDIESGTVRKRRKYQKLCSEIRAGIVKEIWIYRVDRLGRDHYELVAFLQLVEDLDCRIVSLCEPFVAHWRESSWAFRALWEAVGDARYELLRLKERQRDGINAKQDAVRRGKATWKGRGKDQKPRKVRR